MLARQSLGLLQPRNPSTSSPPQLAQAECEVEQLQWQAAQAKRESRQLAHHASSVDNARAADIDGGAPTDGPMAPTAGTAEQQGEAAWRSPEHAQRQASLASSAAGSAVGASAGGGVAAAAECTRVGPQHTGTLDGHQPCSTGAAQQGVYSGSGQAPRRKDTLPLGAEEAAELAAAAVADPLAGMYGPPPPHEAFDSLLSRFQAQVRAVGLPPAASPPCPLHLLASCGRLMAGPQAAGRAGSSYSFNRLDLIPANSLQAWSPPLPARRWPG